MLSREIEKYEVLIIGGGIAGLACARQLTERELTSFRVITKDVGGRIPASNDGKVNYGAFYVRSDYKHVLPFVRCTRPLNFTQAIFFHYGKALTFSSWRNFWHLPSLIRFLFFLRRFRREYAQFRDDTETVSQKTALDFHPWIKRLNQESAVELVSRLGIQYWADRFLDKMVRATSFLDIQSISASYFAAACLPLITRTYEFEFQLDRLTGQSSSRIELDEVNGVKRGSELRWRVTTISVRQMEAKHVVVATMLNEARRLITVAEPFNQPVSVFMSHIRGQLRPAFLGRSLYLFPQDDSDIVLVHEPDGTCLFYSRKSSPALEKYFVKHEIIFQKHWDPAFFLGTHILESERGEGLHLIGDHSVCSLEDAYITGLFTANRICRDS